MTEPSPQASAAVGVVADTAAAPASDAPRAAAPSAKPAAGLRYQWGLSAWWAAFVMRSDLKHLGGIVEETYLPIMRLIYEEPDKVVLEFEDVKALRSRISRFDSPRQRWQKNYGNFVRELEWAFGMLKARLPEPDFEELVVHSMGTRMEQWIGWTKPLMQKLNSRVPGGMGGALGRGGPKASKQMGRSMAMVKPIVGPLEVRGFEDGVMVCYIPDCAMHTCVGDGQPQTNACLYGCKAVCEAFTEGGPMALHFEPNLPATDCIMRVSLDGRSPDPARR